MILEMNDVDGSIIVIDDIENFGAKRDNSNVDSDTLCCHELEIRYKKRASIRLHYNDSQKMFKDAGELAKHIGY